MSPPNPQTAKMYDTLIQKWIEVSHLQPFQIYQKYQQHDVCVKNQFVEISNTNCSVSIAVLKGAKVDFTEIADAITRRMLTEYTLNETWRCTLPTHPRAFNVIYEALKNRCKVPNRYHFICTIRNSLVQNYMTIAYALVHTSIPDFADRHNWIEDGCAGSWDCSYRLLNTFIVDVVRTFQLQWEIAMDSDFHLHGSNYGMYFKHQSHKALVFLCIMHLWNEPVSEEMSLLRERLNGSKHGV